ncbi:MAG: hypothetical protein HUU50_06925 [Candidatus Brocadiae bacterium]|nr:hypothetical protein [Candidatus Brocadiia bacterium]
MTTYKGIVENRWIKMKDKVFLPEGAEVEIVVKKPFQPSHKGSPSAILKAIQSTPSLEKKDTEELRQAIKEGKTPVDWLSPFDSGDSEGE